MKTKEEILIEYGMSKVPYDEIITMFLPALVNAMQEYADQEVNKVLANLNYTLD